MQEAVYGIIIAILVAICLKLYWEWGRKSAAALILIFTAECVLIKNVHPSQRHKFIVKKCELNQKSLNPIVRPLAMWYIRHRGLEIATGFITAILQDLEEDEHIELIS